MSKADIILPLLLLLICKPKYILCATYQYYASNGNYGCTNTGSNDICHLYCDVSNQDGITFDCGSSKDCIFHCTHSNCLESGTLNALQSDNLLVDSVAENCVFNAILNVPHHGNATISTTINDGLSTMTVNSGNNTQNIKINCNVPSANTQCKDITVNAETAQYLGIELGTDGNVRGTGATSTAVIIKCPINSKYIAPLNAPYTAPCIIDMSLGGSLRRTNIYADYGMPRDIQIIPGSTSFIDNNVYIICRYGQTAANVIDSTDNCWITHNPTIHPTVSPTKSSANNPTTNNPTKQPTTAPTIPPTVTNSPSSIPTNNPITSPTNNPITTNPTQQPTTPPTITNSPSSIPTHSPILSPTHNPMNNPTSSPTNHPTITPTKPPTNNPTNHPITVSTPTQSPTFRPTNKPISIVPTIRIIIGSPTKTGFDKEGVVAADTSTTELVIANQKKSENSNSNIFIYIIVGILILILLSGLIIRAYIVRKNKAKNINGDNIGDMMRIGSISGSPISPSLGFHTNNFETNDRKTRERDLAPISMITTKGRRTTETTRMTVTNYGDDIENIRNWLIYKVELEEYLDIFIKNGYNDLNIIQQINDKNQLKNIGINNENHQIRIMREINKLSMGITPMSPNSVIMNNDNNNNDDANSDNDIIQNTKTAGENTIIGRGSFIIGDNGDCVSSTPGGDANIIPINLLNNDSCNKWKTTTNDDGESYIIDEDDDDDDDNDNDEDIVNVNYGQYQTSGGPQIIYNDDVDNINITGDDDEYNNNNNNNMKIRKSKHVIQLTNLALEGDEFNI